MKIKQLFETKENSNLRTNVFIAFLAQGISLFASVVTSLIVPKLLGLGDYAYWQLFLLYSSYVGLLLLGVNDGIYLRLGGKKFDELDHRALNSEFLISLVFQFSLAIICIFISTKMCSDPNRVIIWILVVIYGLFANAFSYVGYIFQATNLTQLYSFACLLNRTTYLLSLLLVLVLNIQSHSVLAILYCISQFIALLYCLYCSHKALSFDLAPLSTTLKQLINDIRAGMQIMVAYYASTMILGFTRLAIDSNWSLADFGAFSFSISIMTFVLAFVGQVSMVLFPALKRQNDSDKADNFIRIKSILTIALPLVYFAYYPICFVLGWWLPEYSDSLIYLGLVLPVCIFDSEMNLLDTTFLKIYRKETALMLINVVALVVSILLICAGVYLLRSIEWVAVFAMMSVALRSFIAETYLRLRCVRLNDMNTFYAEFLLAIVFVSLNWMECSILVSLLTLAFCYCVYLLFNKKSIVVSFAYLKRR